MKSFLLTNLSTRCATVSFDEFVKQYPHEWLVWEAGNWRPPARQTLMFPTQTVSAPASGPQGKQPIEKSKEGLALTLKEEPTAPFLTLGRAPDCDAWLNDGTLSGVHLHFLKTKGGPWSVRDANSRNGTLHNGAKLLPMVAVTLRSGDQLNAAQVQLSYYGPNDMYARLTGK